MAGNTPRNGMSRIPGRVSAAFFVGCAAVALAACGGTSDPSHSRATSTPSHAISAAPTAGQTDLQEQEIARAAVLASYRALWNAQVKAYARASDAGTDLQKYATAGALAQAMGDLQRLKARHQVVQGEPTHNPTVTSINVNQKIPDAKVTDCLDVSGWKLMTDDGKPVPISKGVLKRYIATATVQKWGQRWMVTQLAPDPQRKPC
ncbi:membrane protein [Streptomyces noursei ATCC 11455]|nr:membrane protein [Streptomyces noursei ATCC 11455]ANZ21944.1 membrane protein [Streptomyces noursei ATCC 11455]